MIREGSTFITIIELLWKLTESPDESWNNFRLFFMFFKYSRFWGQKKTVSSAYWRCKIVIGSSLFPISIPSHNYLFIAFLINKFSASTTRLNRKGERGSRCRSPRCSLKRIVGEPFERSDAEDFITRDLIHYLYIGGKPIWVKVLSRKSQTMLSKALWKSSLKIMACFFLLLQWSIISPAISAPLSICRPLMKKVWEDLIKWSITFCSNLARSFKITLYAAHHADGPKILKAWWIVCFCDQGDKSSIAPLRYRWGFPEVFYYSIEVIFNEFPWLLDKGEV